MFSFLVRRLRHVFVYRSLGLFAKLLWGFTYAKLCKYHCGWAVRPIALLLPKLNEKFFFLFRPKSIKNALRLVAQPSDFNAHSNYSCLFLNYASTVKDLDTVHSATRSSRSIPHCRLISSYFRTFHGQIFIFHLFSVSCSGRKRFVSEGDSGLIKPSSMMFRDF